MEGSPDVKIYDTPNNSKKAFIIIFLIFIVGLLIVAGAYWYKNNKNSALSQAPEPTPSEISFPTDTPAPSTSPSASVSPSEEITIKPTTSNKTGSDKSNLNIQILNGSGTAGVAKKASDFLTGLGYTVKATGNADSFDYDKTVIEVVPGKKTFLDQLKKDLSTDYTLGTTSATLSSSTYDAVIIIGTK
ncbi:MAG: LytR C-terminal domain-containing protein [Patescibacteria group bacterium]|nr:LytR C-terminal domain-containing protein [Patescibacteria group bacterium]